MCKKWGAVSIDSLSKQELASLHAKFVVPLVVQDMLRGVEPLDDVAEYSMHDVIGELQPDTALLCVALCAQNLGAHLAHLSLGAVLQGCAERIVDEYGPLWVAHEQKKAQMDDLAVANVLVNIPEDLEEMGDLLLALCGELDEEKHAVAAVLCDILAAEAHMHMEFAEMQLEKMALLDREFPDIPEQPVQATGGNVVAFPQFRRQQLARKL